MKCVLQKLKNIFSSKPQPGLVPSYAGLGFDKHQIFQTEIQPFLDRATELCKKYDIPFLFWTITRCKEHEGGRSAEKSGYVRMKANDPVAIEMALFGNVASGDLPLQKMAQYIVDKLK